ncbi:hypothetical protein PMAYCL1PPCAC_16114, partial [Pristionchus mayeri]
LKMDKLRLRPFHVPSVSVMGFQESIEPSIGPSYAVHVDEDGHGRSRQFEFTPRPAKIAVLLFNRKSRRFMLVRQFRPAVFASRVLQLPENARRGGAEVDWRSADRAMGCTLELCSGEVTDRKKHIDEAALAVVEEEFGFRVDKKYLQHIETCVTSLAESGTPCHLYYAELDNAEIVGEGSIAKRDCVQRVWLGISAAEVECRKQPDPRMDSAHYYALIWWFQAKHHSAFKATMEESDLFGMDYRSPFMERFELAKEKKMEVAFRGLRCTTETMEWREGMMRMNYQIMGLDKSCEMSTPRPDSVAILVKDVESKQLVMWKSFRPIALIGRVMALVENEGKSISEVDFGAYPGVWAYTTELAAARIASGETAEDAVIRVAATNLGYRILPSQLKLVARLLVCSSSSGESEYVYYAECKKESRIEEWKETNEEGERVKIDRWDVTKIKPRQCPPSFLVAKVWLLWGEYRPTREEIQAERDAENARFIAEKWERMEREYEERAVREKREEEEHAARMAAWCARQRAAEVVEELVDTVVRWEEEGWREDFLLEILEDEEEEEYEDEEGWEEEKEDEVVGESEEMKDEAVEEEGEEVKEGIENGVGERKRGAEWMEEEEEGAQEEKRRRTEEE